MLSLYFTFWCGVSFSLCVTFFLQYPALTVEIFHQQQETVACDLLPFNGTTCDVQ